MHVGGQPHRSRDPPVLDEPQQFGDLQLPPQRRARIALRHRLDVLAVGDDQAQRHVRGDHLPHRTRARQLPLQPSQLLDTQDALRVGGLQTGGVGAPVGAHVQHEDVQQRAVAHHPVDASLTVPVEGGEGEVLAERLPRPCRQHVRAPLGVALVGQDLAGIPVVDHLVVVPLHDRGHPGVEPPQGLRHQVVAEVPPVLREGLGDLRLLLGDDVAPEPAVGQFDGLRQRPVGVDGVPAEEEEVRVQPGHLVEDRVAAPVGVDAPALSGQVARPEEPHPVPAPGRGGAEGAVHRLARAAGVVRVGQHHPVVHLPAGRQPVERGRPGEVGAGTEERAAQPPGVAEGLRGGGLHPHPGRAVRAHPHQGGAGRHVTRLHPPVGPRPSRQQLRGRGARPHGGAHRSPRRQARQRQRRRGHQRAAQDRAPVGCRVPGRVCSCHGRTS